MHRASNSRRGHNPPIAPTLREQAAAWKTSGGNTTAATDADDADGLFGAEAGLVDGGGGGDGKVESPAGL